MNEQNYDAAKLARLQAELDVVNAMCDGLSRAATEALDDMQQLKQSGAHRWPQLFTLNPDAMRAAPLELKEAAIVSRLSNPRHCTDAELARLVRNLDGEITEYLAARDRWQTLRDRHAEAVQRAQPLRQLVEACEKRFPSGTQMHGINTNTRSLAR